MTLPKVAQHRVTPYDTAKCRPISHTVPTPSADIPPHSPALWTYTDRAMASDFPSDIEHVTPTADILDSGPTTTSRIKAIERELAQLRSHTRVAPIVPHSAYRSPLDEDWSCHLPN